MLTAKSFGMKHEELLEKLEAEIDKKEEQGWSAAARRQAEQQQQAKMQQQQQHKAMQQQQQQQQQQQSGYHHHHHQQQQGGWQQQASSFLQRAGQAGTAFRFVNDLNAVANATSERQMMIDSTQLVALVGPHTARLLLHTYGAEPPDALEAGESSLPGLAVNGFAGEMAGASADLLVNPAAALIGQYRQGASGLLEGVDQSLLGGVGSSIVGGILQRVSVPVGAPAAPPLMKEQGSSSGRTQQQHAVAPAGAPPPGPAVDYRDALL